MRLFGLSFCALQVYITWALFTPSSHFTSIFRVSSRWYRKLASYIHIRFVRSLSLQKSYGRSSVGFKQPRDETEALFTTRQKSVRRVTTALKTGLHRQYLWATPRHVIGLGTRYVNYDFCRILNDTHDSIVSMRYALNAVSRAFRPHFLYAHRVDTVYEFEGHNSPHTSNWKSIVHATRSTIDMHDPITIKSIGHAVIVKLYVLCYTSISALLMAEAKTDIHT